MWMAALTVSTSANTLAVMRLFEVADVEPDRVGVANVPDDIAAKEQVARAVELGTRRFPRALGILPAHPLDEIVLDERVGGSHAADALDADVAEGVAAHDVRLAGLRMPRAAPVLTADIQADAVGPLDRVAFDDPVMAAAGRNEPALRRRKRVAGMLEGEALDADVAQARFARRKCLLARGDLDERSCGDRPDGTRM